MKVSKLQLVPLLYLVEAVGFHDYLEYGNLGLSFRLLVYFPSLNFQGTMFLEPAALL